MSKLVFNRDGGKTNEFGHLLGLSRFLIGDVINGLSVVANGSPNMTVNVIEGSAGISTSSGGSAYRYYVGLDAQESVAITTANASNPRNDLIVMYVDVAVTPSQSYTNNSNNMLKLAAVAGTPAASPSDPSGANIQAAIGAANPYIILGRVVVGAGVTQINSGNITDLRVVCYPRRVESASFVDNTLSGTKLLTGSIPISKLESLPASTYIADQNGQGFTQNVLEDIVGMSSTITTKGGDVAVFAVLNGIYIAAGTSIGYVYVDGVSKGEIFRQSTSNNSASGMLILTGITAGSHTIQIKHMNAGGASQAVLYRSKNLAVFELAG